MIKLNIQLFGGDDGKDRSETADYNSSGNVNVPGLNGVMYTVPASVFTKIDAAMFEDKEEEVREAKVIMSYYLTYGEYPASNDVAKAHSEAIGLGDGGINIDPNSDAYRLYTIPDLQTEIDKGNVKDVEGNIAGVTRRQKAAGYDPKYGMPVGVNSRGTYLYRDSDTGEYFLAGSTTPVTQFGNITDLEGNPITKNPETGELINSETGEVVKPSTDGTVPGTPLDSAYNQYYNDLFSQEEGTTGRRILDNNVSLYQKEAQNAQVLANTGLQAQAMTQAQAVKQATDAVRSERMAQLRAGMSESQLADRELQMLMGSVNQMSQQAQIASQEATAAQLASNTARENAFNDYITQATALGQNAAANYASEVGDAYALAAKIKRDADASGQAITWEEAQRRATGAPKETN